MTGYDPKVILAGFLVIILLIIFGPNIKEHFGTRYASADREIFVNSKPFVQGTIENLSRLKLQYETTDNIDHRNAIKSMVITQVATLDMEKLPSNLKLWVQSL